MIDTAVILAAGRGSRMEETSGDPMPKVLHKIYGESILQHNMRALSMAGIQKFVVVSGYWMQRIEDEANRAIHNIRSPSSALRIARNTEWKRGNLSSLNVAKSALEDFGRSLAPNFLCVMGDHLFEPEIAKNLVRIEPRPNCFVAVSMYSRSGANILEIVQRMGWHWNYQVCDINPQNRSTHSNRYVSDAGLFSMCPNIFRFTQTSNTDKDISINRALEKLIATGNLYAVPCHPWQWKNINTIDDLRFAETSGAFKLDT